MGKASDSLRSMIRTNAEKGIHQYAINLPVLQSYIDGVRRSNILVIGGKSGSGKTSFVLNNYVYHPLKKCVEEGRNDLEVIVFCLELTKELTLSKLVTSYVFDKFGVEIGAKDMLSIDAPISEANMAYLDMAWPFVEKMEERIIFIEGSLSSTFLTEKLREYYRSKGHFEDFNFVPDNPDLITMGIIDHIGEVSVPPGCTKKQEIDKVANICKISRNVFGTSWCILQQINRSVSNVGRRDRYAGLEMDDFKDSGDVCEKADCILGLYYPYGMKDMKAGGYDVGRMKQRLKVAQVIKSRWGASEVAVGLAFYGRCNQFGELPRSDKIDDYEKYMDPKWLREDEKIDKDLDNI